MAVIVINITMVVLKELYFYYFSGGFSTSVEAREVVGKLAFPLPLCLMGLATMNVSELMAAP